MATFVGTPWDSFLDFVFDPKVEFDYPNFIDGMKISPPQPIEVFVLYFPRNIE